MRTRGIAFYLAVMLPAFGAASGKSDWDRLAQVADTSAVKVHLRDGRALTGNVLEFRPDGLTFMEERRITRIGQSRITAAVISEPGQAVERITGNPRLQSGQNVELTLRDGRVLSGQVRGVDSRDESLTLAETDAALHIAREDVVKVTRNHRSKSAAIGAIGGAGVLAGVLAGSTKDTLHQGESAAKAWAGLFAVAVIVGGGVGAAIGAAIGYRETLYETPRR